MSSIDPIFKILLITYSKYSSGTSPFALAVCIIENNLAEAKAPLVVFENRKFFLQIVKGLIALSQILLEIGMCPSKRKVFDFFQPF